MEGCILVCDMGNGTSLGSGWIAKGILLAWGTLSLCAADDATVILRRFVAAQKENEERAKQYIYVESADFFNYAKPGKERKNRSETHEVMFIEGQRFKKLVSRNGKPLTAKEQAQRKCAKSGRNGASIRRSQAGR